MYDACLMANWDVLAETAPSADYVISSEELVPGLGFDYDAFNVFTDPSAAMPAIFDSLAAGFQADVVADDPGSADAMTLDLVDLAKIPAVDDALTAFTTAAAADVEHNPQVYIAAADAGLRYGQDGEYWAGFLDLGEFLGRLGADVSPEVAAARDALLAAIHDAVVGSFDTPSYQSATGLTVYFPTEPREYDANYDHQPTAQTWRPFLSAFYDAQAAEVVDAHVAFASDNLAISTADSDGYFTVSAPVSGGFNGSIQLMAALPAPTARSPTSRPTRRTCPPARRRRGSCPRSRRSPTAPTPASRSRVTFTRPMVGTATPSSRCSAPTGRSPT